MKNLRQVPVGSAAIVRKIHGEGAVKRRIMDMGITKGVEVYVRKVAPLGDPIEVRVRGYELSLRKADAEEGEATGGRPERIAVIIGPEGGFSDEEAVAIIGAGGVSVSLGRTILRTETAGMAALAMIMYELEL